MSDRLAIIESCLDGLHRGQAEPLFIGDIDWLVREIKRLRQACREISLTDLSGDRGADLCMCRTFQTVAHGALQPELPA